MADQQRVIGIVGGSGWLGMAMTQAILACPSLEGVTAIVSYRSRKPAWESERVEYTQDNQYLADKADFLILSVRPQDWPSIRIDAKGKPAISVMAGVPAQVIAAQIDTAKVIRSIPNAAATVRESYTPWCRVGHFEADEIAVVQQIIASFGAEDECASEDEVDYLCAIAGAGPAYPALLAQALEASAVNKGIRPEVARRAANGVIRGSGQMLDDLSASPEALVDKFLEYEGTTAAGLRTLLEQDFLDLIDQGVRAAYGRSKTLS